jgi:hypothetical protein
MVGNVTALSELDNFSLSFFFLDHSKGSIGKVQFTLSIRLVAAGPAYHVHEAASVTVYVGDAQCVDEAMLEWRKRFR